MSRLQPRLRLAMSSSSTAPSSVSRRPSANGISLDTYLIASNSELVLEHLKSRNVGEDVMHSVQAISELRQERNRLIVTGDEAKGQRKSLSQQIGQLMKAGKAEEVSEIKAQVEKANAMSADCDAALSDVDDQINSKLQVLPNLLADDVPDGSDEDANQVIYEWGASMRKVGEEFLWHDEIATKNGGYDMDAAARISGARFAVLRGPIARLERALGNYFMDFQTARGYQEVSVPYIVRSVSTLTPNP